MKRARAMSTSATPYTVLTLIAALLLIGCAKQSTIFNTDSYILGDRNYTFAIYSKGNRLLTHPIHDLLFQARSRGSQNAITDVYVISHGWNYKISEVIPHYHSYISLIDDLAKQKSLSPDFQPYFIFVTWTSVSRPTGDLATAVLPYGLDDSLTLLTGFLDNIVLFLPSVWKQSMNAATIALGKNGPEFDRLEELRETKPSHPSLVSLVNNPSPNTCGLQAARPQPYGTNPSDASEAGTNTTFSSIVYQLIKLSSTHFGGCGKTFKIHLVGHSYGAKLLALSGIEAQRRWILDVSGADYLSETDQQEAITTEFIEKKFKEQAEFERFPTTPIESLIMINPAMAAREFDYGPSTSILLSPLSLLKFIKRKAIVYSNYDYPNGVLFDLSQIVLDNQASYNSQVFLNNYLLSIFPSTEQPIARYTQDLLYKPLYGAYILGVNVASGAATWGVKKAINFFPDWYYHIQNNKTFDHSDYMPLEILRKSFNAAHFLFPLDRLLFAGQETDQMGIFRHTVPSLGKSGLNRMAAGREWSFNKWIGLSGYLGDVNEPTEISRGTFCQLSKKLHTLDTLKEISGLPSFVNPERIYSLDASDVYNAISSRTNDGGQFGANAGYYLGESWDLLEQRFDPRGSHSDVGSSDTARCSDNDTAIPKREFSFNFIYNFTQVVPSSPSN